MATHLYFQFLPSVHTFPFFRFQFQSLSLFPLLLDSSLPLACSKQREREKKKKKKKKDQKASLLASNNQEISKHSWFAIGLNERTAFLIFFPLFLFNSLVFLSFHLFVLVSLRLSVITIVLNVLC